MTKTFGQKIALTFAVLCYLAAAGCAAAAVFYPTRGAYDVIQASLIASIVFFAGAGIVLHVIATTRLKGILTLPKADSDQP